MRLSSIVLAALLVPAALAAQDRDPIRPPGSPTIAPFTPGIRSGNLVFASGTLGIPPGGTALVPGGIRAETRQVMENLERVFQAAGTSLARSVKCLVFLADLSEFAAMNEVYATFFPNVPPPARSTVGATLLFGARVEIECIAVVA
jgi:2-iminobutanoate/2-iminopropanoate deaminase